MSGSKRKHKHRNKSSRNRSSRRHSRAARSESVNNEFNDQENLHVTVEDRDDSGISTDILSSEDNLPEVLVVRKQYNDLIESCQSLEARDGIETEFKEKLTQNMDDGNELFKKVQGDPSEMYTAFVHTQMCSGMILSKTEYIGHCAVGFTVDKMIEGLIEKGTSDIGVYDPRRVCSWMTDRVNEAQMIAPSIKILYGVINTENLTKPPAAKQIKQRAPRKRFVPGEIAASQHQEVRLTEDQRTQSGKEGAEAQSKEILQLLLTKCVSRDEPLHMVEFTMHQESLRTYFENIFCVAFLVRDGYVSVRRRKRPHNDKKDLASDLVISPEEPPVKLAAGGEAQESVTRSQHIVSFNAAIFKALARAFHGNPMIPQRKSLTSIEL